MWVLVAGLLAFIGVHLVTTQREMRAGLIARFGEGGYKGLYSAVAAIGLVLIVLGYPRAQIAANPQLWNPPAWGRHVNMLLMLPVFPLLFASNLPGRISAAVRHPMITAVKLWALAHLLVRGDLASMLLFGGLLGWAVVDRISVKRREAAGIVTIKSGPVSNDVIALVGGLIVHAVFFKWGHATLIGVPLIR